MRGTAAGAGIIVLVLASGWIEGRQITARQSKVTTEARCAAELGVGADSRRRFCDVIIATSPGESVLMSIPPHTGPATLMMDLHNRFTIPPTGIEPADAFERHAAVVAVVTGNGERLEQAVVGREFRSVQDLFDRIAGGGRPGGVKSVAPGQAEAVRAVVPSGVDTVGIVGVRLHVLSRAIDDTFDAPGRPVAIVSNLRIEYIPQ